MKKLIILAVLAAAANPGPAMANDWGRTFTSGPHTDGFWCSIWAIGPFNKPWGLYMPCASDH